MPTLVETPMAKKAKPVPATRKFRIELEVPAAEVHVSFQRIDARDFSRSQKFGWQAITDSLIQSNAKLMDGTEVSRRSHAMKWIGEQMAKAMNFSP